MGRSRPHERVLLTVFYLSTLDTRRHSPLTQGGTGGRGVGTSRRTTVITEHDPTLLTRREDLGRGKGRRISEDLHRAAKGHSESACRMQVDLRHRGRHRGGSVARQGGRHAAAQQRPRGALRPPARGAARRGAVRVRAPSEVRCGRGANAKTRCTLCGCRTLPPLAAPCIIHPARRIDMRARAFGPKSSTRVQERGGPAAKSALQARQARAPCCLLPRTGAAASAAAGARVCVSPPVGAGCLSSTLSNLNPK